MIKQENELSPECQKRRTVESRCEVATFLTARGTASSIISSSCWLWCGAQHSSQTATKRLFVRGGKGRGGEGALMSYQNSMIWWEETVTSSSSSICIIYTTNLRFPFFRSQVSSVLLMISSQIVIFNLCSILLYIATLSSFKYKKLSNSSDFER